MTDNETNQLWRAMKADLKTRRDRDEPKRLDQMRTNCDRLGVTIRQLSEHTFRLTLGDRWVDYCPRTRKVWRRSEVLGDGLRAALQHVGVPPRDIRE